MSAESQGLCGAQVHEIRRRRQTLDSVYQRRHQNWNRTYGAIQGMLRQAEESHDAARADQIREALEDIKRYTTGQD